MKVKRIKKQITALALAAGMMNCVAVGVTGAQAAAGLPQPAQAEVLNTPPTAVFAWDGVRDSDVGILAQHNITAVFLDINHTDCMPRLQDFHIFLLAGDTNWGVEEMQKAVQKATTLGAAGIVLDVEGDYPTLADNLEKLRKRLEKLEKLRELNHTLPIYVCVPYWLEGSVLERIVRVTDGCIIMNYNRSAERQQMDEEIKLCEKYRKSIYHAIELQKPGKYGLTPINTYFGAGGIREAERRYREEFGDTAVGFAIHNLEMLRSEK